MEDFSVARYLFDRRPDGRHVRKVSILQPDHRESSSPILKATYRDLNRALQMDFWLLKNWRAKHAPDLEIVI